MLGVLIRPSAAVPSGGKRKRTRELVFLKNGSEVGVAATGLGDEPLCLAVQPYMGGVALLV